METRVRSSQVIRSISFRSKASHSQNTELYFYGQNHSIGQNQSQNLSINSSLQPLSHKSQKSRDWIKDSHIFGRVFLLLFDYLHSRDKEYLYQFSHVNYFLIIPIGTKRRSPSFLLSFDYLMTNKEKNASNSFLSEEPCAFHTSDRVKSQEKQLSESAVINPNGDYRPLRAYIKLSQDVN